MGVRPTATSNPAKVATLVCAECSTTFSVYRSQLPKNARTHFCSTACKAASQRRDTPTAADTTRFWSYVDQSGGSDACWEWTAARHPDGYGKVSWPGRPSPAIASRIAFELGEGRTPVGMVRHSCDNPPCCNPAHLLDGTQLDNMRDAAVRGRTARGRRNGQSVLTEDQVREIRRTYVPRTNGWGATALARKYGVSPAAIMNVVSRRSWKHVD